MKLLRETSLISHSCRFAIFASVILSALWSHGTTQEKQAPNVDISAGAQGSSHRKKLTLLALRAYVGKRVRIQNSELYQSSLLSWRRVEQTADTRYEEVDGLSNLPSSYARKEATIIAVQINRLKLKDTGANALGESASPDDQVDPYTDFILRFDDGTLTMTTNYPSTLLEQNEFSAFIFTDDLKKSGEIVKQNLQSLVGLKLYAVHDSELYNVQTNFDDLRDKLATLEHKVIIFPRLQPLTITKAAYSDAEAIVVLKVTLPDNALEKEALIFSRYKTDSESRSLLERVSGTLLTAMPKGLTPREIEAIRHYGLFVGMSTDAVYLGHGYPESENDWGNGGTQLVYRHGKKFIYLRNDRVTNWQLLDDDEN